MTVTNHKQPKAPISAGIDPSLIRRLDAAAKAQRRSRAAVIVLAIEEWLDTHGIVDPDTLKPAQPTGRGSDAGTAVVRKRGTRR